MIAFDLQSPASALLLTFGVVILGSVANYVRST